MLIYIARRILLVIPTIFFVSMIVFLLIQLIPGDVIEQMIVDFQYRFQDRDLAEMREKLGIDVPIHVQSGTSGPSSTPLDTANSTAT